MAKKNIVYKNPIASAIHNNNRKVMTDFYKTQIIKITKMVNSYNIKLDAGDVFQEGFTRAVLIVRDGEYKHKGSFAAYLYVICRNICRKEYNDNKKFPTIGIDKTPIGNTVEEPDHRELIQRMLKIKDSIKEDCQKVIDARFGIGISESLHNIIPSRKVLFKDVAKHLGISKANARKRFQLCMEIFREIVLGDDQFKLLHFNITSRYDAKLIESKLTGDALIEFEQRRNISRDFMIRESFNNRIAMLYTMLHGNYNSERDIEKQKEYQSTWDEIGSIMHD